MASPSLPEGRMSAAVPMPISERLIRGKMRRNRSRDPRLASISGLQFRPDSQRARSTSRKRPHDDDLVPDSQSFSVLSSSYPGRSSLSNHSSPASQNSQPSPPGPVLDFPNESSPRIMPTSSFGPLNIPQSPASAVSTSHFDYDFGLSQSPSERWATPDGNTNGLKFFPSGSQSQPPYSPTSFAPPSSAGPVEQAYLGYDGVGLDPTLFMPGSSPPSSSAFAATGLPFRGLDFIRNYNPAGYGAGSDQEWQAFDPGAFVYDPEIPFTLGDASSLDGQQRWNGQ